MAIVSRNAELTISNPQLSSLAGRRYGQAFTLVPNDRMPGELLDVITEIFRALTGDAPQPDAATLKIAAKDGVFSRLYTPKLYRKDGGLSIKWGNQEIALEVDNGELKAVGANYAGVIKFTFTKFNPSGRGDDPGLEIKVMPKVAKGQDQPVYSTVIAVAVADWKNYNPSTFSAALYDDSFPDLLLEAATGGGSGPRIDGKVVDTKAITAAFPNGQTETIELTVTMFKAVQVSYGQTFILQCQPLANDTVNMAIPETAQPFGIWATGKMKLILQSQPAPEISEAKPATVVIPPKGQPTLLLNPASLGNTIDLTFV